MRWGRVWSTGCTGPTGRPPGPFPAPLAARLAGPGGRPYREPVAPTSLDLLRRYFEDAPAARRAAAPLRPGARVALTLDEGPAGFALADGRPVLTEGRLDDPDFTLRLPAAAVARLAEDPRAREDVGEAGLAFFRLALERDPAVRAGVSVQASTARLVAHGYLAVLALGGARVGLFLLRRGLASPARVIDRLRQG